MLLDAMHAGARFCLRDGSDASSCGRKGVRRWCVALRLNAPRPKIIANRNLGKIAMVWSTPILVEICIGLEINGYLPAEF
jgi:coenzyme PQQ precursor peptide PqqA